MIRKTKTFLSSRKLYNEFSSSDQDTTFLHFSLLNVSCRQGDDFFHFEEKNIFIYSENESKDAIALENSQKIKAKRNEETFYFRLHQIYDFKVQVSSF